MPSSYKLSCAVWELTLACNLKCLHCGSTAGGRRAAELSTLEALDLCADLKRTGCLGVALMGGEPLLRADFFLVAARVRELGMELSVITNGTVAPEGVFGKLKKLEPRAVAVSLDAADPELHDRIRGAQGAFKKSRAFIERCLAEKLPVSVITTVHKLNLRELPKLRELLKGRGIAWQVQTAGAEGGRFSKEFLLDPEEFYSVGLFIEACRRQYPPEVLPVIGAHDLGYNSLLLKNVSLYEKWEGCQAGTAVAGIRSDGSVLGCLAINDDKYAEGNVRERSFYDIWNDPASFRYTRAFKKEQAGPNCAACPHAGVCKGGCSEMSLMKTGALHNDPYCFRSLEKDILKEELKNPLRALGLKLGGRAARGAGRLGRIFSGGREGT
ncbi:MAG TPA: radical SAM/SPASM domain-containing protein [Elusimicrobia bacterium]|nr:MAG: radical SAM protein [Elusimicrobia bacterium GWF2_62_30]HBA61113.1 radical SAM/SPASM domain-containing protein [Elusimicrobiota bacterium]